MGPHDLIGLQFGEWSVISLTDDFTCDGRRYALCRCSCGTERKVSSRKLRRGLSKSCGCLNQRRCQPRSKVAIPSVSVGDRFATLTVVETAVDGQPASFAAEGKKCHLCLCDCGRSQVLAAGQLSTYSFFCACQSEQMQLTDVLQRRRKVYQKGARRRNLAWELPLGTAAALFLSACVYCGSPPTPVNGIDRVDNALGYLPSNVVACCWTCNRAKGAGSAEQFKEWLERISKFRGLTSDPQRDIESA